MRLGDKLKRNFAKNLQSLRTRNDLTQAKLVDALNDKYKQFDIELQRTSIVNYEAEGAMPRIDALYCIADYFGKTIDQMISPTMDRPALTHQWMTPGIGLEPTVQAESGWRNGSAPERSLNESAVRTDNLHLDTIMTTCVEGILYRQFYVEVLKNLFQQLQENAATAEEREKVETMFYRTFLGCQISKSKYLQDLAETLLDEQEFKIFMFFKDSATTISMVAKALEITEETVVTTFNSAQSKISSVLK